MTIDVEKARSDTPGCRPAGQMPLDVQELGCDMLSVTSRKFLRGPRGVGFLYVSDRIIRRLEPPTLDLHAARLVDPSRFEIRGDARRFETWETNVSTKIGMGRAIDYALEWGVENIWVRVSRPAQKLRKKLTGLGNVAVHDLAAVQCGIVSFSVEGVAPERVHRLPADRKMNASVSPAAYTLIDMQTRGLHAGVVRASVHSYNTEEEIDRFCDAVASLVR